MAQLISDGESLATWKFMFVYKDGIVIWIIEARNVFEIAVKCWKKISTPSIALGMPCAAHLSCPAQTPLVQPVEGFFVTGGKAQDADSQTYAFLETTNFPHKFDGRWNPVSKPFQDIICKAVNMAKRKICL